MAVCGPQISMSITLFSVPSLRIACWYSKQNKGAYHCLWLPWLEHLGWVHWPLAGHCQSAFWPDHTSQDPPPQSPLLWCQVLLSQLCCLQPLVQLHRHNNNVNACLFILWAGRLACDSRSLSTTRDEHGCFLQSIAGILLTSAVITLRLLLASADGHKLNGAAVGVPGWWRQVCQFITTCLFTSCMLFLRCHRCGRLTVTPNMIQMQKHVGKVLLGNVVAVIHQHDSP